MENFTWNKLKVVPVDTENNSFAHFKTFVTKFIGFYKTYSKDLICEITIFSSKRFWVEPVQLIFKTHANLNVWRFQYGFASSNLKMLI